MVLSKFDNIVSTLQENDFPVEVLAETTAFCNLQCVMCPQKTLTRPKGEMSFEIFKKIVDEIASVNPSTRLWFAIMGEALLLKDKFVTMVRYAKEKGIVSTNLNTNACLLTPELSDMLIDAGLDEIIIGLDAFTGETYKKIRIGGDFEKTLSNIMYLIDAKKRKHSDKPHVLLQYIIMDENEHEVEAFRNFWIDKGVDLKIRQKVAWGNAIQADNLNLSDGDRTFPCPMIVRNCAIHWDGTIAHCSDADFDGQYPAGDIKTQSIKEVWNGELKLRREKHWNLDFSHPLCRKCKDWQIGRSNFVYADSK